MGKRVSIITINFNNLSGLKMTVESVVEAKSYFESIEYLVIDGFSTDGSVEFLNTCDDCIDKLIVEKDQGIFDAMNKGLNLATGDYLLFLNSGDYLVENVLPKIFSVDRDADIIYGDTLFLWEDSEIELYTHPDELTFLYFLNHSINHQSTLIKRDFHIKYPYSTRFRLASDWEFFMKSIVFNNAVVEHIAEPVCFYDMNGMSSNSENRDILNSEKQIILDELGIDRILSDYEIMNQLYRKKILKYFQRNKCEGWRLYILRKILSLILR